MSHLYRLLFIPVVALARYILFLYYTVENTKRICASTVIRSPASIPILSGGHSTKLTNSLNKSINILVPNIWLWRAQNESHNQLPFHCVLRYNFWWIENNFIERHSQSKPHISTHRPKIFAKIRTFFLNIHTVFVNKNFGIYIRQKSNL